MDPTDLIWMNGELIAMGGRQESTSSRTGCTTGRACSRACAATTQSRPCGVPQRRSRAERLLKSAELYYMPVPYSDEELRAATREVVARNGLRSCYIRPIVFRGYGTMGLNPLEAPVDVTIACWEWGAYLGEEGSRTAFARRCPRGSGSARAR